MIINKKIGIYIVLIISLLIGYYYLRKTQAEGQKLILEFYILILKI